MVILLKTTIMECDTTPILNEKGASEFIFLAEYCFDVTKTLSPGPQAENPKDILPMQAFADAPKQVASGKPELGKATEFFQSCLRPSSLVHGSL